MAIRDGPERLASSSYHWLPMRRALRCTSTEARLLAAIRNGVAGVCCPGATPGKSTHEKKKAAVRILVLLGSERLPQPAHGRDQVRRSGRRVHEPAQDLIELIDHRRKRRLPEELGSEVEFAVEPLAVPEIERAAGHELIDQRLCVRDGLIRRH